MERGVLKKLSLACAILLGLVFAIVPSFSTNPSVEIKWKTQWIPYNDYGEAYATCSDGRYVYVVGCTNNEGDGDNYGFSPVIIKIDPETGEILSKIRYEPYDQLADNDWDCLYDCVVVGNYLYVIGETSAFSGGDDFGRHIAKIDLTTFTKVVEYNFDYVSNTNDYWHSIDSDGTYLYVGGYTCYSGECYFIIQKLDLNGNVINTYEVDAETTFGCRSGYIKSQNEESLHTLKYHDGFVYFGGSYYCLGDWGGDNYDDDLDYRTVVVKLNANDLSLVTYKVKDWYTQTWEGNQYENIFGMDVDDEGVYVVGRYYDGSKDHSFLWKLDLNLNEVSSTTWLSKENSSSCSSKVKAYATYLIVFSNERLGSYFHHALRVFDRNLEEVYYLTLDNGNYYSYFFYGKTYLDEEKKVLYVAGFDDRYSDREWTIYALELKNFKKFKIIVLSPQSKTYYISKVNVSYVVSGEDEGLVAYWKFDEGQGNIVHDYSGNGNDGEIRGMYSLEFDGEDDYVEVPDAPYLDNIPAISVVLWFKMTDLQPNNKDTILINKEYVWEIGLRGQDLRWALKTTEEGWYLVDTGYDVPLNQWIMLVLQYDGNYVKVYVDGQLIQNYSYQGGPLADTNYPVRIASRYLWGHYKFKGRVAEVRIYNRALSESEIQELYQKGPGANVVTDGLVLWHCYAKKTLQDLSGNENDGTAHGDPQWVVDSPNSGWVDGKWGKALSFDGVDDCVEVPYSPKLYPDNITITAWFYSEDCSTLGKIIKTDTWTYIIGITGSCKIWVELWNETGSRISSWMFGPIETNKWYFLAVAYDSRYVYAHLYNENGLVFSGSYDPLQYGYAIGPLRKPTNSNVKIGAYNSEDALWKGIIDEVRIYNRALSEEEIKALYEKNKHKYLTRVYVDGQLVYESYVYNNERPNEVLVDDSLVLFYHFETIDTENNKVIDASAYGNDGTIHGATVVNGKFGKALRFDGDDWVEIPAVHSFTNNLEGSYGFWFKINEIPTDTNRKIFDPGSERLDVNIERNTGKIFVWFKDENGHGHLVWVSPDDRYADGNWHFIFVNKDSDSIDVWIDGSKVASFSTTLKTYLDLSNGAIGATKSGTYGFTGEIDEVRIYNRALSEEEIWQLYTSSPHYQLDLLRNGTHEVKVEVKDLASGISFNETVPFNLDLYDTTVTYSNYTRYNSSKYVNSLNYQLSVRCGALGHSITVSANLTDTSKTYTIICDNSTKVIEEKFRFISEGNKTVWFKLNAVDSTDDYYFGNETFVADLYPPEIKWINTTLVKGFRFNFTETGMFNVEDSISPILNCSFSFNHNKFNELVNNNSIVQKNYNLVDGLNTFSVSCKDLLNHSTSDKYTFNTRVLNLSFIMENNGTLYNPTYQEITIIPINVSVEEVYNLTTSWVGYVDNKSGILRVQYFLTDGNLIYRDLELDLLPTDTTVCISPKDVSHYEQLLISGKTDTDVIVKNTKWNCIVFAGRTRYYFQDAFIARFYTISGIYYLYRPLENSFLVSIDGGITSSINLDLLQYVSTTKPAMGGYLIVTASKEGDNIVVRWINVKNDSTKTSIVIERDNTILFSDTLENPNDATIYLNDVTLNLSERGFYKVEIITERKGVVEKVVRYISLDGSVKYLNPNFAIIVSILFLLVGLTQFVLPQVFGILGLISHGISLMFLLLAPYTTEVKFMIVIHSILLLYNIIVFVKEYAGKIS